LCRVGGYVYTYIHTSPTVAARRIELRLLTALLYPSTCTCEEINRLRPPSLSLKKKYPSHTVFHRTAQPRIPTCVSPLARNPPERVRPGADSQPARVSESKTCSLDASYSGVSSMHAEMVSSPNERPLSPPESVVLRIRCLTSVGRSGTARPRRWVGSGRLVPTYAGQRAFLLAFEGWMFSRLDASV
jgi:hypothetical protein